MLQQILGNEMRVRNADRTIVSLVTQCVVLGNDPAFTNPTKPIGPFFTAEEARERHDGNGWTFLLDSARGYRRIVPSPRAIEIVEWDAVIRLVDAGVVVIAAGGGGVPVVREWDGRLRGVEAVIDKDQAAAVLARQLRAKRLITLTAVSHVCWDYGKPSQREVKRLDVAEARRGFAEGQFPPGSMGPKVAACIEFVEGGGEEAIITSPDNLRAAIEGLSGTRIVRGEV
jgi:carbamate kinase